MSPLQQRMLEDMQLRGLSARTQQAYSRAVWQLAQHYHRSLTPANHKTRLQFPNGSLSPADLVQPRILSRLADSRDNNP